jgi:hypothetical protein
VTAIIAQLVAAACKQLGLAPAITSAILQLVGYLVAQIPEAKLEAVLFSLGRHLVALVPQLAHWLATRPPAEWGGEDQGGNIPAAHPPVVLDQPLGDSEPLP